MISLHDKIALVTGGWRGIGGATALRLAEAGADIVLNYVSSRDEADRTAERIAEMGRRVAVVHSSFSAGRPGSAPAWASSSARTTRCRSPTGSTPARSGARRASSACAASGSAS